MTALAEPDYFEEEDYHRGLAARYEEGFGHTPDAEDDYDNGFDEIDRMLDGLLTDDEDDFDAPAKKPSTKKSAAAKATTVPDLDQDVPAKKATAPRKASAKTPPKASPVITRRIAPLVEAPAVEESPEALASDLSETPAAEAPTEATAVVVVEETAAEAAEEAVSVVTGIVDEEPAPEVPASPFFAPHIAAVNEHVELLRKLRPGFEVPYVDPMHSIDDCRILSLFSNNSAASPQGVVWAGDDDAATRLLGLQYQLGLRPEWMIPWNTHPWFTPGEANGKLTPEQVSSGLKPLIGLLRILPRVSAIVAHGTEANRLAQMLLKTDNPLIWRRGLKVYKARSLHGRSFAGSKERQTEWLIDMGRSYADAMARAGLQSGRR